jgi:hypothetical protein
VMTVTLNYAADTASLQCVSLSSGCVPNSVQASVAPVRRVCMGD